MCCIVTQPNVQGETQVVGIKFYHSEREDCTVPIPQEVHRDGTETSPHSHPMVRHWRHTLLPIIWLEPKDFGYEFLALSVSLGGHQGGIWVYHIWIHMCLFLKVASNSILKACQITQEAIVLINIWDVLSIFKKSKEIHWRKLKRNAPLTKMHATAQSIEIYTSNQSIIS